MFFIFYYLNRIWTVRETYFSEDSKAFIKEISRHEGWPDIHISFIFPLWKAENVTNYSDIYYLILIFLTLSTLYHIILYRHSLLSLKLYLKAFCRPDYWHTAFFWSCVLMVPKENVLLLVQIFYVWPLLS